MGINIKIKKGILEIKGKVYKRTSVSSIESKQKNENESKYIRLCNENDFIYGM